jgi:hypothetical protein
MAAWAADCAERVLPFFENAYPKDDRPAKLSKHAGLWVDTGVFKMADTRRISCRSSRGEGRRRAQLAVTSPSAQSEARNNAQADYSETWQQNRYQSAKRRGLLKGLPSGRAPDAAPGHDRGGCRRPETASEDEKVAGVRRLGVCPLRLGLALRFRAYGIAPDRLDAGRRGFVAFVVLAGSGECPPAWRLGGLASGRPPERATSRDPSDPALLPGVA